MLSLVILAVISIQIGEIASSQLNPSCAVYDFNEPLILDQFEDCTGTLPLIIKSYNGSLFQPYRPTSQRYLSTNASLYKMQCLRTKIGFRGTFASMAFKMGFNLRNNETTYYNNFQFFVGNNLWGQQLNPKSNGWELYERFYNFDNAVHPTLGPFENYTIGLRAHIGNFSDLAIEYIKFYNPQLTDENCNNLHPIETSTSIIETTTTTSTTEASSGSPITETPSGSPTTETSSGSPITETPSVSPTTEASSGSPITETPSVSPTTEASSGSPITETPIGSTNTETTSGVTITETTSGVTITETTSGVPITETSSVSPITEATTEVPSTTETTTTEYITSEAPIVGNQPCLKADFSQSFDQFQECYGLYLQHFIQKPYTALSVLPYRPTSKLYLSNKWEGLSCLESINVFALNETSFVESAIYLNGRWPGAYIEVYIIDEESGDRLNLINVEPQTPPQATWRKLSKNIGRKFDNARIFIMTNMNSYSQLAVEYLNILNSDATYSQCTPQ